MTYLVGTHVLIWHIDGNKRLSQKAVTALQNPSNKIVVSNAALWEIVIKTSIGKLQLTIPFHKLENFLLENNFESLEYDYADLDGLLRFPFHHHDPFNRIMIAQAIVKNLTVISDDEKFKKYPVKNYFLELCKPGKNKQA